MNQSPAIQRSNAASTSFRSVASLLYLGVLFTTLYDYFFSNWCAGLFTVWQVGLCVSILLFLLLLEQVEQPKHGLNGPIYVAVMLLVLRFILFEVIDQLSCSGFSKFLYFIVPFQAYFILGRKVSLALSGFYLARLIMEMWYLCPDACENSERIETLLMIGIGLVFVTSMARVIKNEEASRTRAERLLAELEASHQKLREYSTQVAELAATEERNRLAREIHDSLGHYLTVINVQLEKAMAFRERNPQEADQAVRDAKRSAREALQDVRESVGALRRSHESFFLSAALNELVEQLENGDLEIDLQIEGQETGFSKAVLFTLYRAVQEGLTNVQKHASASQAVVHICFDDASRHAILSLRDDGKGFDSQILDQLPAERHNGFGLQGLVERVELVGGQMELQSAPHHGTHLLITVPKNPLALRISD
ncbi:MAG: sensor histidine kinase [Ardenticatenaceae bacterium]